MSFKTCMLLFHDAFRYWREAKAPRLGAALAFYAVISLAPLLVLLLSLVGLVFGREAAAGQLVQEISGQVGRPVAEAVQGMIQEAHQPHSLTFHTIVGLLVLLFGASGVFAELQDAMNTIWQVTPKPNRVILTVIRERFLSFTMIMGVCFLLLVSLVVTALLAALSRRWTPEAIAVSGFDNPGHNNMGVWFWQGVNFIVSFLVATLLFAVILKVLPDAEVRWRDVWIGATLTSFLFSVGKFLLGLYLEYGNVTTRYGAAGSLVIVLLWVYYGAQILMFGATFTRAYAERFGPGVKPTANAVLLSAKDRAEQGIPTGKEVEAAQEACAR